MRSSQRKKPVYRRPWFLVLLALAVLVAAGGFGVYAWVAAKYGARAGQYDLAKMREMESASLIFDRKGRLLGRIYVRNRDTIPLKELPASLISAVIAAEDNRFYQHKGVDYVGMARAAIMNYRAGRITQGASTLTQQLARNSFELLEKSYERKLVEVFLAKRVEQYYTKNDILELYLNRVYYGAGLYGAEAAAKGYFGKSARDLTVAESAMLAGLLKSPNNLSPWSDRRAAVRERDFVLGRMLELGFISRKAHDQAIASEPEVKNRKSVNAESYALEHIRQQVISELGFENAQREGYRITTTIDADIQAAAERALARKLNRVEARPDFEHQKLDDYAAILRRIERDGPPADGAGKEKPLPQPEYLQGAVVVLDNVDGGILALVGGRDFDHSEYNRAILSRRPAGTAFLPVVYAAAFEKGFGPGYPVEDEPMDNRQVMIGGTTGVLGEWGAEKPDIAYEGLIPARRAIVESKNAASVRLGMQVGLDGVTAMAKELGIASPLRPYPATFLGSSEVSLMELTQAFIAFASSGARPQATHMISKILEKSGRQIYQAKPSQSLAIGAATAYQVHSCLAESLEVGTADKATTQYGLKRFDGGGKTGTAYNFSDLWFVGYDSEVTCGVWVGFDKPHTIYRGAFSSDVALPVWVEIMNATLDSFPPRPIPRPANLKRVELCLESGGIASEKCVEKDPATGAETRSTWFEWLTPAQMPLEACPYHNGGGRALARSLPGEQYPRAVAAANLEALEPVVVKSPTIVGDADPYGAVTRAVMVATAAAPAEAAQVRRAEPVRPFDAPSESPAIELAPPKPLEF